nr:hypothetical protein [Serratia rubidaea]
MGVSIGGRLKSGFIPGSVSLLQQTPEDKALGDVLLDFPGTLRLIEFKTQENNSKKELIRYRKLFPIIQKHQEMLDVSRKIHWYVETAISPMEGLEAFFSPYLNVFDTKKPEKQPFALEKFIKLVADDAISSRNNERDENEKNYLKLVRWCQGVGETGAGALIVVVGSGGGLEFVAIEDLMALNMSYQKWMAYRQEKELKMEKTLKIELEKKELQKQRGWSYER